MSQLDQHLDHDLIALLALGETPGSPAQIEATREHLASCEQCRDEVADFARVVDTARGITPADALVSPPESVWAAVAAEVARANQPLARSRRSSWLTTAAAACVGLILGGGAMYAATASQDSSTGTSGTAVVASASLAPLAGSSAHGQVQVVSTSAGPRVLVDVTGLAAADGYYEVWLLDREGKKLVALGALDASAKGSFAMPAGIEMSQFPIVDVSLQEANGNPEHSKNSLVRGTLPA